MFVDQRTWNYKQINSHSNLYYMIYIFRSSPNSCDHNSTRYSMRPLWEPKPSGFLQGMHGAELLCCMWRNVSQASQKSVPCSKGQYANQRGKLTMICCSLSAAWQRKATTTQKLICLGLDQLPHQEVQESEEAWRVQNPALLPLELQPFQGSRVVPVWLWIPWLGDHFLLPHLWNPKVTKSLFFNL